MGEIIYAPLDENGQGAYEFLQRNKKNHLFDIGFFKEPNVFEVMATYDARKNTVTFVNAVQNGLLNQFLLKAIRHIAILSEEKKEMS